MKKSLNTIFIPLYIVMLMASILSIVIVSSLEKNYLYPFNKFDKIEDTMSLSKNHKNVVYIMVDMTTGFDVTSILQNPENKELADNFTDFTNYLNVITNNWGTNASVPNLFGGYDFDAYHKNNTPGTKDITLREYMTNVVNVLTSAFGANDWSISAVGNQYYNYDETKSYWDSNWKLLEKDFEQYNLQAINSNDVSRMLYYQYPEVYKKLNLPENIFLKSSNANFMGIEGYLEHLKIQDTDNSKFLSIMDESNHVPLVMDDNGVYQESATTVENIYMSTKGFLTRISNFISYLKANDIYDNTMIVINSDHGNNGTGSLPVNNPDYNFTGTADLYNDIKKIEGKYGGFTRAFPTLLVKPYGDDNAPIKYDNDNLYTNADALTFIKEYNDDVNFEKLNQTKDYRFLNQLSDVEARKDKWLPSYKNDSLWNDSFYKYLTPDSAFGGYSFLITKNIYELSNYLVARDLKNYYSPEDLDNWVDLNI